MQERQKLYQLNKCAQRGQTNLAQSHEHYGSHVAQRQDLQKAQDHVLGRMANLK
jgi:hypothetical protein